MPETWEDFLARQPSPGDEELGRFAARELRELQLARALTDGADDQEVFERLGVCIESLADMTSEGGVADCLRELGVPEWSRVSIDGQNLADRVAAAWRLKLQSGDEFRSGHDFPGKEKDLVIEMRHPGARTTQTRTQTRAVFNGPVLNEHLEKMIRLCASRLDSDERPPEWLAALRRKYKLSEAPEG